VYKVRVSKKFGGYNNNKNKIKKRIELFRSFDANCNINDRNIRRIYVRYIHWKNKV
jgi:hypothetical protein